MTCCDPQQIPMQTIFLGVSVVNFSASMQWNGGQSDLTVTLREDQCQGPRAFWNEELNFISGNYSDAGFFGENRYQRASDSTLYSSCIKEDPSDTLIRSGVDLVGMPSYFRIGEGSGAFEFAGIISDWVRTNTQQGPEYKVKLVDPRLILDGVQLIIGDYTGAISGVNPTGNGGTGEPQQNLFNIYGFLEQFGLVCPSYSQCTPAVYTPTTTCTSVDGPVFGTFVGGFGGSLINANGMPYNYIVTGFNFLANSFEPVPAAFSPFSPYGRVSFHSNTMPSGLTGLSAGLIQPDNGGGIYADKNFYFVDLSELPAFPDYTYRINGTSITLLDLVTKASEDLNFDFYFEFLPIKDPANEATSLSNVAKVIKLRTTLRSTQPSLDKICEFIQNNEECVVNSSFGEELRNETVSKFIIGGRKHTIYQADNTLPIALNPDSGFTTPTNATDVLASLDSYLGTVRTATGCNEIDNLIIPYFGLEANKDLIVPCINASGFWEFEAPVWTIQQSLQTMSFSGQTHVTIDEQELMHAAMSFNEWHSYIQENETDTYLAMSGFEALNDMSRSVAALPAGGKNLPRDFVNPKVNKFKPDADPQGQREIQDRAAIYNWVRSYNDYYGKKFAVRVPFTCVVYDPDSLQPVISEAPTNNGGWTEVSTVIGLKNNGPLTIATFDELNFFRNAENKITPFVGYDNAVYLSTTNLDKDAYFWKYTILTGSYDSGDGPPVGAPGTYTVYRDNISEIIYTYFVDGWFPISEVCVLQGSGTPSTGLYELNEFCPLYVDTQTDTVYLANDVTYGAQANVSSWGITLDIKLYVKARVEENYVFHDDSNFFAPRVVVEVPDAVTIPEPEAKHLRLITRSLGSLAGINQRVGANDAYSGRGDQKRMIDAAAISMVHKTLTYGPWFNPTIAGRTEVVNSPELVPWRYNGFVGMNLAGTQLANESRVQMQKGELGTLTVVGHPTIPLGAELNAINDGYFTAGENLVENRAVGSGTVSGTDYDGNLVSATYLQFSFSSTWQGTHGPNVTDLAVRMGADTIETTYNMRTFTPRRGFFERYNANRLATISTQAVRVTELLREENRLRAMEASFRGLARRTQDALDELPDRRQHAGKSADLIAGELVDHAGGKRTNISVMPIEQGSVEVQYPSGKAFTSWDQLLAPVSMDGYENLPRYIKYTNPSGFIDQDDMNPLTNPSGKARSTVATVRSDTPSGGHFMEVLARESGGEDGLITHLAGDGQYKDDYGFIALRGPLVLHSWGYDTSGNPVPNKADDEGNASSGTFTTVGLNSGKFMDDHLKKPHTWPVAPIDLRLDRDRGVWVAGSGGAVVPPSGQQGDEFELLYVSGNRDSCCMHSGYIRERTSFSVVDPCSNDSPIAEALLYVPCDILTAPDCVVARKLTSATGVCNPSGLPVYEFYTRSQPQGPSACDCCCPISGETDGQKMYVSIVSCRGEDGPYEMTYYDEPWIEKCGGGNYLSGLAPPFTSGWMSEEIHMTVQFPIIVKEVNVSGYGDALYLSVDYQTCVNDAVYYDAGGGTLVPYTSGWEYQSDTNNYFLYYESGTLDLYTRPIDLYYRVLANCGDSQGAGTIGNILIVQSVRNTCVSGAMSHERSYNPAQCIAFNATEASPSGDTITGGNTSCLDMDVTPISGAGTFVHNPWGLTYYGACGCGASGGYPIYDYNTIPASHPSYPGTYGQLYRGFAECTQTDPYPADKIRFKFRW